MPGRSGRQCRATGRSTVTANLPGPLALVELCREKFALPVVVPQELAIECRKTGDTGQLFVLATQSTRMAIAELFSCRRPRLLQSKINGTP